MQGRGREPTGSRQLRRKGWGSHDWGVPGASAHPQAEVPAPVPRTWLRGPRASLPSLAAASPTGT